MPNTSDKTFKTSKNRPITRVARPFQRYMKQEATSGILLILSIVAALIWINIDTNSYNSIWDIQFQIQFNNFILGKSIHLWINEFLMTLFFLLVGLEIKREMLIGELSSLKQALLPTFAAIGGMLFPALVYLIINPPGTIGARGWAIPMATDIAFALGILYLLGKRVPTALRILLASLAIVDDIGAVLVIAFFYTENIKTEYLLYAGIIILLLAVMNMLKVFKESAYLLLGLFLWYFIFKSGLHATISGVILAIFIPARTQINYQEFRIITNDLVSRMNTAIENPERLEGRNLKIYMNTVQTLEKACEDVEAPLQKLEHNLVPIVTLVIMPIFALSNGGVSFRGNFSGVWTSPISYGIILGLILGKPIGIFLMIYLSDKFNIAKKPVQLNWWHILGMGMLAGIGFTMSTFISVLAFPQALFPAGIILPITKIAILIASFIASITGVLLLLYGSKQAR